VIHETSDDGITRQASSSTVHVISTETLARIRDTRVLDAYIGRRRPVRDPKPGGLTENWQLRPVCRDLEGTLTTVRLYAAARKGRESPLTPPFSCCESSRIADDQPLDSGPDRALTYERLVACTHARQFAVRTPPLTTRGRGVRVLTTFDDSFRVLNNEH
jgi:hypothetical protein